MYLTGWRGSLLISDREYGEIVKRGVLYCKITIDGVEYLDNEESKRTINQAIKNNELKNIELGYPSEKQIKAIKQINAKKREIIATHKVITELKKVNKSYKHIIQERDHQKEVLKMLKEHNKKLLEKQTYVHSRRQYDIKQFKSSN